MRKQELANLQYCYEDARLTADLAEFWGRRRLVQELFALRMLLGFDIPRLAEISGLTEERIRALEQGEDSSVRFEDLVAYIHAVVKSRERGHLPDEVMYERI